MLYGHVETYADRADHLIRLREAQDETAVQPFHPAGFSAQEQRARAPASGGGRPQGHGRLAADAETTSTT